MGKRDATAGHGDERTREGGDNSERRSESDLERRRGASGTAETERFKINKMSCENVFGSLQNLRVFFRPFTIYLAPLSQAAFFLACIFSEPIFSNGHPLLAYFQSGENFPELCKS